MVPELVTQGPPILVAVGFALLLLMMAGALGLRVLGWLGAPSAAATPAERGVLAVALGAGALQVVPLALGAVGMLSVLSCRVAVGLLVVVLARDMLSLVRRLWLTVRSAAAGSLFRQHWVRIWLLALAPAVFVAFIRALTPTLDADGLTYHLTAPKRWLESGWLHYLPTYVPTHTPMGADMLFVLGLPVAGDIATKTTHFGLGIFAAIATYGVAARLSSPVAGIVAASLLLVGPSHITTLLGNAYTEGAICLALAASLLACVLWLQERHDAWLNVAGLLVGIAVSFKLTAVLFAVALVA
ncbi:MAG TPA: glycosyltransferase family 39 protein, partial [Polyangiaceae bacterium]|nr:glycosyltransferase family 39 protein [Polyangiaceae bacterium]